MAPTFYKISIKAIQIHFSVLYNYQAGKVSHTSSARSSTANDVSCQQISNTLVQVCMTNIEVYASGEGGEDRFWSLVSEAILSEAKEPSKDHPLITQLNSCLQLTTAYKELLYQLKDGLFQQQVSFSVSTVGIVSSHTSCISKKASGIPSSSTPKKASHKHSGHGGHPMNTDDSASIIPQTASGIPLHNVDKITSGMNDFGLRVSRVLEIVSTLARFRELQGHMGGLPRIAGLWDLEEEVIPEGGSEGRSSSLPEEPGGSGVKLVTRGPLSTLREESLMSSSNSEGERTREREQTAREEEVGQELFRTHPTSYFTSHVNLHTHKHTYTHTRIPTQKPFPEALPSSEPPAQIQPVSARW